MPPKWSSAELGGMPQDSKIRVGFVEGAIGGPEMIASLAILFPKVQFIGVGAAWPEKAVVGLAAMIIGADARGAEAMLTRLGIPAEGPPIIVVLRDVDAAMRKRFAQSRAADVLTAPLSEAALALSLERLLAQAAAPVARKAEGKVVGLLKAGGGVGATILGIQLAHILAARADGVCFADLDIQFGQAALKLDIDDAMTLTDILGGSGALDEAALSSVLKAHRSGVKLLAAPRDLTPLEAVTAQDLDGLMKSLRREFAVTLVDLPGVWTAWTNHALHLCDQILLVTNLSVPHVHLVKRQLGMLASQSLDLIPITLVCNRMNDDQRAIVPLQAAEKAFGRKFDFVIPDDHKAMNAAVAQGSALSTIRPGTKLEKAIEKLADSIVPSPFAAETKRRGLWP